jgi:hypothetical protein
LIETPLKKRGFSIETAAKAEVVRMSSRSPHDANIIMHYALEAAREERVPGTTLKINTKHIDSVSGRKSLIGKYQIILDSWHIEFNHRYPDLLKQAMENPPPWDKKENPISMDIGRNHRIQVFYRDLLNLFSLAGFRQRIEEDGLEIEQRGGKSELPGLERNPRFKLWIPWGLTLYFRELYKKGGN